MRVRLRPRVKDRGNIPASGIKKAYERAFGISFWGKLLAFFVGGHGGIQLADQTYAEARLDKINEILAKDRTEQQLYSAEDFDCDDFAFSLMGGFHRDRETAAMPIFITWVLTEMGGHAVLSFFHKGQVIIIEPQTDDMLPVPKNWKLMLLCG